MSFRHVVVLTLSPDCDVDSVLEELRSLPAQIPVRLRSYTAGRDAGVTPGNATVALVVDAETVEDFIIYRDHPAHKEVGARIGPFVTGRAAIQHRVEEPA